MLNLLSILNVGAKTQLLNKVFTVLSSRGPDPSSCFYLFECLAGSVETGVQDVQLHTQCLPPFYVKIQVFDPKSCMFILICTPNV